MEVIDKKEYISKIEVVRILQKAYAEGRIKAKDGLASVLDDVNAVDVQLVKRGHWDYSEKENGECAWYFCSECDSPAEQLYTDEPLLSEFCPHCNADMRNDSNLMETEVDGLLLAFEEWD